MATKKPARRSRLGTIYQVREGNWVARYNYNGQRHVPGHTFPTPELADQWLMAEALLIARDQWTPPADRRANTESVDAEVEATTLGEFAEKWIDTRTTRKSTPLSPRSQQEYRSYLNGRLAELAAQPIRGITRAMVDAWWQDNADVPVLRHHIYSFLGSVMSAAVSRDLIVANPCKVENAASRRPVKRPKAVTNDLITGLTPLDIAALSEAMRPAQWKALIMVLAYSGLRPSEALALSRDDIICAQADDGTPRWTLKVTKALSRTAEGGRGPRPPKTTESIRFVPLPPHVAGALAGHLDKWAAPSPDGLLFPSTNPANEWPTIQQLMGTAARPRSGKGRTPKMRTPSGFNAGRIAIGRPEMRLYDLRRWARHMWRKVGLGDADCEQLLGHKLDPVMYAYVTQDREQLWPYMEQLSRLAGWTKPVGQAFGGIDHRLLAAMTAEQLTAALAGMSDAELAKVVPSLPTESVVKALATRHAPIA